MPSIELPRVLQSVYPHAGLFAFTVELDRHSLAVLSLDVCEAFEAITGFEGSEMRLPEVWNRFAHPSDENAWCQMIAHAGTGRGYQGEFRILTKDAKALWVKVTAEPNATNSEQTFRLTVMAQVIQAYKDEIDGLRQASTVVGARAAARAESLVQAERRFIRYSQAVSEYLAEPGSARADLVRSLTYINFRPVHRSSLMLDELCDRLRLAAGFSGRVQKGITLLADQALVSDALLALDGICDEGLTLGLVRRGESLRLQATGFSVVAAESSDALVLPGATHVPSNRLALALLAQVVDRHDGYLTVSLVLPSDPALEFDFGADSLSEHLT